MYIHRQIEPLRSKTAVAMGYFDGVHLGHRAVISRAVEEAKENGLTPAVFTFETESERPTGKGASDLISLAARRREIEALGIEQYVCPPFDRIRKLSAKDFVKYVLGIGCFNAAVVVCGPDFRFGRDIEGDIYALQRYCGPYGTRVVIMPPVSDDKGPIKTTRIKMAIKDGNVAAAAAMLGRPYVIELRVNRGAGIGVKLGYPTLNQTFPENIIIPRFGVYASCVQQGGYVYPSVTNIGVRPTIYGDTAERVVAETHIPGFKGELYNRIVTVELRQFMRAEMKFASPEQLSQQIGRDIELMLKQNPRR